MSEGGRVQFKANVNIDLIGPDGVVKDNRLIKNLIVNAGLSQAIRSIVGDTGGGAQPAKFNYVALGEGTTAPAAGDTDLETEETGGSYARQQDADPAFPSTGQGEVQVTFGAGVGEGAITESGLLNHVTAGTLLARVTFSAINKGALDSLQITWRITLS